MAKWLDVALPEKEKPISENDKFILDLPKSAMQEFEILPEFYSINKRIVDLNFPQSAFIVMVKRNGVYIRPGGSTEIKEKDTLMIIADNQDDFSQVNDTLTKAPNSLKYN